MTAIVLGWNPDRWDGWQFAYTPVLDVLHDTGFASVRCPLSTHLAIPAGTDVWLILQGAHERGLLGHGIATTDTSADRSTSQVTFDVDLLLPRGEHIPETALLHRVPGLDWESNPISGTLLATNDEQMLRAVWADHAPSSEIDPVDPVPGTLPASALTRVSVNRYERDPEARRQCIAHQGTSCSVCRFNFEDAYGALGHGFIQVHHIVPVSQIDADYVLDPLTDLVPLCPNCHAMAHSRTPAPYSPAELRRLIRASTHMEGTVLSPEELSAQENAARILGT
ncbi:HNH endonuclease [Arthrobacter sp. H20]|uniref:HNH endonuclease n=1 Tax=Arthrobacter sp. H20 TaxID=1267981 RepID=UPI0004B5EDF2|nr:HNH endonuclease [Arthrobacter sp. H20]